MHLASLVERARIAASFQPIPTKHFRLGFSAVVSARRLYGLPVRSMSCANPVRRFPSPRSPACRVPAGCRPAVLPLLMRLPTSLTSCVPFISIAAVFSLPLSISTLFSMRLR